jgi:hypothetical protein
MVTITAPPEPTVCTECGGSGTVEKFVTFVGMTDARCKADNCDDGIVR